MSPRTRTPLLLLGTAALLASEARAATCYSYYRGYYTCNGGLSSGARIGIGIAIAVGVLLLFAILGYWRRKRLMNAWRKHNAQQGAALPQYQPGQDPSQQQGNNAQTYGYYGNGSAPPPMQQHASQASGMGGAGGYAPPPGPPAMAHNASAWSGTGGVKAPQSAYNPTSANGGDVGEHGYEWEQARENERLEREAANARGEGLGGNGAPPPGYDVAASSTGGSGAGAATHFAPPEGPPPARKGAGVV